MLKKLLILTVVFLLGFFTAGFLSFHANLMAIYGLKGLYEGDLHEKARIATEEGRWNDAVGYWRSQTEFFPAPDFIDPQNKLSEALGLEKGETVFSETYWRRASGYTDMFLFPFVGMMYFAFSDQWKEYSSEQFRTKMRGLYLLSLADALDMAGRSKEAAVAYREATGLLGWDKNCDIAGEYYTFCDCGTNTTITLQKDGKAEINAYSEGETTIIPATWTCKDAIVELRYNGLVDTLSYAKRASDFGWDPPTYGYWPSLSYEKSSNEEHSYTRDTFWSTKEKMDYNDIAKKVRNDALVSLNAKERSFMDAIIAGDESAVIAQIKQGANVNLRDANSTTPLMYAVQGKNINIVRLLLDHGADVNAVDNYKGKYGGNRPIDLIDLHFDNIEMIKLLVEHHADCNISDGGETPLAAKIRTLGSASKENVAVLKYLVSACADINVPDGGGKTPLQLLEERKFEIPEVVKVLKEADAARRKARYQE